MRLRPLTRFMVGGWLAMVFVSSTPHLQAQAERELESGPDKVLRFDRVVAVSSAVNNERKLSSAFFIELNARMFLITAKHSAAETNLTTEVALPSVGTLRIFRLAESLCKLGANPWTTHESADLAVCEIDMSKIAETLRKQIATMAVTLEQFQRKTPERSSRIEVLGFPMGIGVTAERISPVVTNCFVASEELNVAGTWGKETNFFAAPATGSGASGGMVTLHDEDAYQCAVVGLNIGFNADNSGAKLARIIPASVIVDFLRAQTESDTGSEKSPEAVDTGKDEARKEAAGKD